MQKGYKTCCMFFLCVVIVILCGNTLADDNKYILLLVPSEENPEGKLLEYLDTNEGTTVLLTNHLIASNNVYISPNRGQIAFKSLEESIIIISSFGEQVAVFDFSEDANKDWHLWGWFDDNQVILSQSTANYDTTFYKFTTNQSQIIEFTELNLVFRWNLLQLQSYFDISIYDVIVFSPNFQYFLTPFPPDIVESDIATLAEAYIWSVFDSSEQPLDIISNIIPWWYPATTAFPNWSKNGELLTFGAFNDNACPTEIYIYEYMQKKYLLDELDCPRDNVVYSSYFSWSNEQDKLLFWRIPVSVNVDSSYGLVLFDADENIADVIYETNQAPRSIYWSENDSFMTFSNIATDAVDLLIVSVMEVQSLSIVGQYPFDINTRIVGWLRI